MNQYSPISMLSISSSGRSRIFIYIHLTVRTFSFTIFFRYFNRLGSFVAIAVVPTNLAGVDLTQENVTKQVRPFSPVAAGGISVGEGKHRIGRELIFRLGGCSISYAAYGQCVYGTHVTDVSS